MEINLAKKVIRKAGTLPLEQYQTYIEPFFARLIHYRRTHLYCVGTAKSGTHSVYNLFKNNLRSAHEPDKKSLINVIQKIELGKMSDAEVKEYIHRRDQKLYLEIDSSQFNFFILDALVGEFEKAQFLLTVRNCYAWLDSFINHTLAWSRPGKRKNFTRDLRFRPHEFIHPPEEYALKELDLYTLDGYLSYWTMHNERVINTVPENRLLVIQTDKIKENAGRIANFAGVSQDFVNFDSSHAFRNPNKFNVLSQIDRDYLELKVDQHCRKLMDQFFPKIRTAKDAGLC